jgi:hypothetical protein
LQLLTREEREQVQASTTSANAVKNTFGNAGEKYEVVQRDHGRDGRELKQIVVTKTRNVDDTDMMSQVVAEAEAESRNARTCGNDPSCRKSRV